VARIKVTVRTVDSRGVNRCRPSPGVLLGIVAIVLACAGSATAGALITGSQIKDGSITGTDVKDGSLTAADFTKPAVASRSARGPRGRRGKRGPRGFTGFTGPRGLQGPPGLSAVHIVSSTGSTSASALCTGVYEKVVGGGAVSAAPIIESYPYLSFAWRARVTAGSVTAYAICANVSP
jgi:hypothetical protein